MKQVDMKQMPKFSPIRPDFMSLGQKIKIEKKEGLLLEAAATKNPDEEDDDDDFTPYRYYESEKILGKLYRAIDEHEVFSEIKKHRMLSGHKVTVLDQLWVYVQKKSRLVDWRQHLSWAQDIREMCVLPAISVYPCHF